MLSIGIHSLSEKVKVTHLELFLDINFDDTNLIGKVHVKCEKLKNVATGHLVSKHLHLFTFI